MNTPDLARRVRVARGLEPGDLLFAGGRVVNVFTGTIERADVVVVDGWIAGVGPYEWTARERIDCSGRVVSPGLIDAHIHLESTLLVPAHFARLVVPRGTSAVVADPHEIVRYNSPPAVTHRVATGAHPSNKKVTISEVATVMEAEELITADELAALLGNDNQGATGALNGSTGTDND